MIKATKIQVIFVLKNGLKVVLSNWSQLHSLEKATASNSGANTKLEQGNKEFQPGSVSKQAEGLLLLA